MYIFNGDAFRLVFRGQGLEVVLNFRRRILFDALLTGEGFLSLFGGRLVRVVLALLEEVEPERRIGPMQACGGLVKDVVGIIGV